MGNDSPAAKKRQRAVAGAPRPSRKRRILLYFAIPAVLLLGALLDVAKRDEYCMLCGKGRTVWVLRFPPAEMGTQEHSNGYSVTLDPLVHGGGGAHVWHVFWDKSLLARMRWAIRSLRCSSGSGGMKDLWWNTADAVATACRWDPELDVAAAQYLLACQAGTATDSRKYEDVAFGLGYEFPETGPPVFPDGWNELRRMVGLPELSADEMERLISEGEAKPDGSRRKPGAQAWCSDQSGLRPAGLRSAD